MVALFAQQSNIVEFPQKSSEWYTPARYVEAAREVMGSIDLDPASSKKANETVKATQFYTVKENGLVQEWYGKVWLNPPYGRSAKMQGYRQSTIKLFVDKLLAEYAAGNVEQAIILATTEVNAVWYYPLWQFPICFPDHRVHFYVPEKLDKYCQMFGTSFAYIGPYEQKFIDIFSQFGTVARRVSQPKVQPVTLSLWEVQ